MDSHPMDVDAIAGGDATFTHYVRPDGSRYALDRLGRGHELPWGEGVAGPARFDARPLADGLWAGSRSTAATLVPS